MEAFFLAAAMHPDCQKAAQGELDNVVGPDRLPEFSDYDQLPYMRAFIKEVMRWHIVTPMGLPHATMEDDEYNGHFIPAGTIVNVNIWCIPIPPSNLRSERTPIQGIVSGFRRVSRPGRFQTRPFPRCRQGQVAQRPHRVCIRLWAEDLSRPPLRPGVTLHLLRVCASCLQHHATQGQRRESDAHGVQGEGRSPLVRLSAR